MNNIEEIQTLLKKQKAQMRVLMKMQNLIFDNQQAINRLLLKELKTKTVAENEDKLLSPSEAAEMLNISASTLARKKKAGEIPFIQSGAGKKVLYSRTAIVEYLKGEAK